MVPPGTGNPRGRRPTETDPPCGESTIAHVCLPDQRNVMGFRNVAWVLDNSPYKGVERLIHVVLADCANDEGGMCWPSQAFIARRANCTVESVRTTVKRMLDDGFLVIVQPSTVKGTSHRYAFRTSPNLLGTLPKSVGDPPQISRGPSPNPSSRNHKEPERTTIEPPRCAWCRTKLTGKSHFCSASNMVVRS